MKNAIGRGLIVALVTGITFFYPLLAPVPHRIDEVHLKMIRNGMSLSEVESVFGVPPGEYDSAEWDGKAMWAYIFEQQNDTPNDAEFVPWGGSFIPMEYFEEERKRRKQWLSRNGSFSVQFDTSGFVSSAWHLPFVRIVPPWERLRRRFGTIDN